MSGRPTSPVWAWTFLSTSWRHMYHLLNEWTKPLQHCCCFIALVYNIMFFCFIALVYLLLHCTRISFASLHSYIILLLHCTRILICKASATSKLLLHCTSFCIILIFEMHMALSKYVFSVNKVQTCVFCTNFSK